jgi:hypothetical protein
MILGICFIVLNLLTACATTTLTSVWRDPDYQAGQIKKMLVIGVSDRPAIKRLYEDEFAKKLRMRGIEAIPSYAVIPPEKMPDQDFVKEKVKELNVDAVLITRLLDKQAVQTFYPPEVEYDVRSYPGYIPGHGFAPLPAPYYHDWYGHYYRSYEYVTTPGYTYENQLVRLETNIYLAKNDTLIWSALSDTFVETDIGYGGYGETVESLIKSFVDLIMKRLTDDRVL